MQLNVSRRGDPFYGCPRFPACRGSRSYDIEETAPVPAASRSFVRAAAPPKASSGGRGSLVRGDHVVVTTNDLGAGRYIGTAGQGQVAVQYFDNPGQPAAERHVEIVSTREVRRHTFAAETRVFWEADGGWRSGRVQSVAPDGEVEVQQPGASWSDFHDPHELYVRWDRPIANPVGFAIAGLFESPHNVDARRPLLRGASDQLRAARGLTGLLSAAVELHAHQVAAARRVLEDHRQRYLLADEVGLGKTVETILVMRQLLVDDPALSVRVIAPRPLIGQWEQELQRKLLPEHFPLCDITVVAHDDPTSWQVADLLVVDEAHHLVTSRDATTLLEVAHASPRVLLLSATPALHNERAFAAMLHLLDPDVYAADDVDGLRARLEARTAIGRAMVGIQPNMPSFLVAGALKQARESLRGEPELLAMIDEIEAADDPDRPELIATFQGLVGDVFQLHRRMIRTRRSEELVARFPVASRHGVERVELPAGCWDGHVALAEQYAEEAALQLEAGNDVGDELADIVSAFPDAVAMARLAKGTPLEIDDPLPDEDELVEEIVDAASYLANVGDNVVLFAPTARLARLIAAGLAELLPGQVGTVLTGDDAEAVAAKCRKFSSTDGLWLICDVSAQEGANLQAADVMVHVGLPGRVNELEQRIGRVDRWVGRAADPDDAWRSYLVSPDRGFIKRWAEVVEDGFGVHERSVASLQRAVEEQSLIALGELAPASVDTTAVTGRVRAALYEETKAVVEQDAVDSVTVRTEDVGFTRDLLAVDAAAEEVGGFAEAFHGLMTSAAGNLRFMAQDDAGASVGRYLIGDPRRKGSFAPLVPTHRLRDQFKPVEHLSWAGRRAKALEVGAGPLRVSSPIVDATLSFLRDDDRGRCWGMWRWDREHAGPPAVWWRVDLLVSGVVGELPEGADGSVVQRLVHGAFPPGTLTVWVTDGVAVQPDEPTLDRLEAPYLKTLRDGQTRLDRNLRPTRVHALLDVLDAPLAEVAAAAVDAAERSATSADDLASRQALAVATIERASELRKAALRRRRALDERERVVVEEEIAREEAACEAAVAAVTSPTVTVDSIGVMVLSGAWPFGEQDEP